MAQKNFHDYEKYALKSGLTWTAEKEELFDKKGNVLPVFGIFRSDTHRFLGAVSGQYEIVQAIEILKMPELLVAAGTEVEFVRAGETDGGERIFAEYRLPFQVDVKKVGDIVRASLLTSSRHDGKGSVVNHVNLERLACTNGMTMKHGYAMQIARHDSNVDRRIEEMKLTIAKAGEDVAAFGQLANSFASTVLSMDEIKQITEKVFFESDTNNIYNNPRKQEKARSILSIFEANDNDQFKKQRGTAWNLLNAFTNFTDHRANYRSSNGETPEQARTRGALFGSGHAMKWHALNTIALVAGKNHKLDIPEQFKVAEAA